MGGWGWSIVDFFVSFHRGTNDLTFCASFHRGTKSYLGGLVANFFEPHWKEATKILVGRGSIADFFVSHFIEV